MKVTVANQSQCKAELNLEQVIMIWTLSALRGFLGPNELVLTKFEHSLNLVVANGIHTKS